MKTLKLAATALSLPVLGGPKPLTLLGGLTSFGGAGNNYSMHALTEMTRQLRAGKGKKGLVLCNGGVLSYQHVVILGTEPRRSLYPVGNLLPEVLGDVEVVHGSLVAAAGNVLLRALLGSIWGVGSFAQVHQMQAIPLVNAELGCQFVRDISQCFVQFLLDLIADLICGILEVAFQPGPDRCGSG